jgi:O-6-methylguanine DNA methyltransferase
MAFLLRCSLARQRILLHDVVLPRQVEVSQRATGPTVRFGCRQRIRVRSFPAMTRSRCIPSAGRAFFCAGRNYDDPPSLASEVIDRLLVAVASACAANPVAMAVPCHRVVRSNGDLAGYRWGVGRKHELIRKEAMV